MELVLACNFNGRPKPTVSWTYEGSPLNDTFQGLFTIEEFGPGTSVLRLDVLGANLASAPSNIFQCIATNNADRDAIGTVNIFATCECKPSITIVYITLVYTQKLDN